MIKEYEKKALLSQDEYNKILILLKSKYKHETVSQINYYYDTDDLLLFKKDETLRIRKKSSSLLVQYKRNKHRKGNTRICEETSYPISKIPKTLSIDKYINQYNLIGCLETVRTNFYIDKFKISLDKSKYFNITDYEIEVESHFCTDEIPTVLQTFLINFSLPTKGKYKRFIETYKRVKETIL